MRWLYLFPTRHPWWSLACVLGITALAFAARGELVIDNRTENILPSTNSRVQDYERFRASFGTDELLLVGFKAPDGQTVLEEQPYALLTELTERMRNVPDLAPDKVISLTTIEVPQLIPTASLPLLVMQPLGQRGLSLEQEIDQLELLDGLLISEDRTTACVVAQLKPEPDPRAAQARQLRAVLALEEIIGELEPRTGGEMHMAGTPVTKAAFVTLLERDLMIFLPVSGVLIALVLLVLFRSWRGVVLPLLSVALAILFVLTLMTWTGNSINTVTSLLPPLILAMGVGVVIHVMTAWRMARIEGVTDRIEAVEHALDETIGACALTTITTMAGFLSLLVSPIGPIQEFGVFAALGVLCAFFLAVTLVPAVLTLFPGKPPARTPEDCPEETAPAGLSTVAGRVSERLGRTVMTRPLTTLVLAAVVTGGMVTAAIVHLEVEVDFLTYFKREHAFSRAVHFFQDNLSGAAPLELLVDGPENAFTHPAELRRLEAFQERLGEISIVQQQDGQEITPVDRTLSVADFIKALSVVGGGPYAIPDDPQSIRGVELMDELDQDGSTLDPIISQDLGTARISARLHNVGSQECAQLVERIEEEFAQLYGDSDMTLTITGSSVIFLEITDTITRSQFWSFALALAFVFGCILCLFRSLRLALISLVPNLFPITMMYGVMALSGLTLNMNTVMVASIGIGIAVDDTIHFLASFKRRVDRGSSGWDATLITCRRVGTACATTSVILCAGFGVSTLASFIPTIQFGALSALVIASAYVGDFVVLPAMMARFWPEQAETGEA